MVEFIAERAQKLEVQENGTVLELYPINNHKDPNDRELRWVWTIVAQDFYAHMALLLNVYQFRVHTSCVMADRRFTATDVETLCMNYTKEQHGKNVDNAFKTL